ncbi:hypothetical protein [Egicoccus sp. AB-alg6-2]|uniref:hypothetical protein n=1 Tax=Egicoccus sp. AB-alg6-2 TaxID=3242692 RepID=UPI00359E899D
MDPITLLQITHVEQRVARATAAAHNAAVRQRRARARARRWSLGDLMVTRRAAPPACATC